MAIDANIVKQLRDKTGAGMMDCKNALTESNGDLDAAIDSDPRKMAIKHGTGKNLEEFLRHALGQRETQERGLESYDQGYLLSRKGSYARAPWIRAPITSARPMLQRTFSSL